MMRPPTSRVDAPHEVVQASSRFSSFVWKVMPLARAKFCPRKWLVPAWSAFRSCIMASMQYVSTAPGKRSLSVFLPRRTGMAR